MQKKIRDKNTERTLLVLYHSVMKKSDYKSKIEVQRDIQTQKSRNKTSLGVIDLNIRRYASSKVGQGQVSRGTSFRSRYAKPIANISGNLTQLGNKSNLVIRSSEVTGSQIGVMSDQCRVSLHMVIF